MNESEKNEPSLFEKASIRPATEDDLEAVSAIENRVHAPTHLKWTLENFSQELEKPYSRFWVMTDDETDSVIYGFLVGHQMGDSAEVLNVAVDLSCRGLGLGRFLLRSFLKAAMREGFKKAVLEVRKSNLPAIHLYQSSGFLTTQVRKGFYADGEDAYLMTVEFENGAPLDW